MALKKKAPKRAMEPTEAPAITHNADVKCAHDVMMPIAELKARFHPKNPNKHSQAQIEYIGRILKYQGARRPVNISKQTDLVIVGHGRVLGAESIGWTHYPVNFQDYADDAQQYADMVADNALQEQAELDRGAINRDVVQFGPDFDVAMLAIPDFTVEVADKLEPQCDEDEVPEYVEPKTKLGDAYILGNHRLLCGDSTQIHCVDKLMNGEKSELCFTSPPYSDQREYRGDKELSTKHLATFIRAAYGKANYFAVNLGYSRKNGEVNPYWDDYIKEAKDCGLKFLSWNIWNKETVGSIGNQTAMFAICHEWIFVFGSAPKDLNLTVPNKNAGDVSDHSSNRQADGSIKKKKAIIIRDCSQLRTVLNQTPQLARNHDINHPAMFPVEFPEQYIEGMTNSSDSVYEPFGGSGSTLIACEKTNRRCFMMELDPHYCDVIIARWEKYTGKKAELLTNS
jgi:DNA modification methylase